MGTTILNVPTGAGSTIQTEFGNYTVATAANGAKTVTVDSRLVPSLLSAGFSVYVDDLPIGEAFRGGLHGVSAGEASAHTLAIATGLTTVTSFVVQILRANIPVIGDAVVTEAAGTITVADGASSYAVTSGDEIRWMANGVV